MNTPLPHYINGRWQAHDGGPLQEVVNPATQEILGCTPLSGAQAAIDAAEAAQAALPGWRRTPAGERVQPLFRLKDLLETHRQELARLVTQECGKTLDESLGEVQRAIENLEMACGIPSLLQGDLSEDIAPGIDEMMLRQPVGVCAGINPFNFPAMIPFWFFPYAIACGNTYIVKPSERVPLTLQRVFQLVEQVGLPPGVLNLVNGGKETVDALLDHPYVRALSFVGSTEVAHYVYRRATANGKRAQCQGGAKNPVVILPDADMEMAVKIVADSAFGCAGQRCLAAALALPVGEAYAPFREAIAAAARSRVVGYGLDSGVQMGPVITPASQARIEGLIAAGIDEGARPLVDGRRPAIPGYENGNFVRPTVLDAVPPGGTVHTTEIFGPVLGLMPVASLNDAIQIVNNSRYANMACVFTGSGAAARQFRSQAEAGNIGVNIGVPAPLAQFPFSGWKDSFFGDLHGQGKDAVDFFTQKKVVIERWPKEWSRTF